MKPSLRPWVRIAVWCGLLAWSGSAAAWAPSAHAYIAMRVAGPSMSDALYGAVAPDLMTVGEPPAIHNAIKNLTHFHSDLLAPSMFAVGFAAHNNVWGADYYSHCYWDPNAPPTYFTERLKMLSQEFGLPISSVEELLEPAVDYVIRRDLGPDFLTQIARSAEALNGREEEDMVRAFTAPLAAAMPGLSLAEAEADLRKDVRDFRVYIRVYGEQLASHDLAFIRETLVTGMASYFDVDDATADQYVSRAEDLCWDWQEGLDDIAAQIRAQMQTTVYRVPVSFPSVLIEAAAILAAFVASYRRLREKHRAE